MGARLLSMGSGTSKCKDPEMGPRWNRAEERCCRHSGRTGGRGLTTGPEGNREEESALGATGNHWNVPGRAVTWSDDGVRRFLWTY